MDSIRQGGLALLQRIERFFDAFFGAFDGKLEANATLKITGAVTQY